MRSTLTWLIFIRVGLSKPFLDSKSIESLELRHSEGTKLWTGADGAAHKLGDGTASNQPRSPLQYHNEERTLIVGLEQVGTPRYTTFTSPGVNQISSTTCSQQHDYTNRYFFYRLEHVEELDSLCNSELVDFYSRWPRYHLRREVVREPHMAWGRMGFVPFRRSIHLHE